MTKQELLYLISTLTKEDFQFIIDTYTNVYYTNEIDTSGIQQNKLNTVKTKLLNIGFEYPEVITKEFVLGLLVAIKGSEFIGDDLSGWVDAQVELFGTLDKAFIELVYNKL